MATLSGRTSYANAASTNGTVIVGEVGRWVRGFVPSGSFLPERKYDAVRWSRARGDSIPRARDGSIATDLSANGSVVCGAVDDAGEKAVIWIGAGEPMAPGDLPRDDGGAALPGSRRTAASSGLRRGFYPLAFRWTAASGRSASARSRATTRAARRPCQPTAPRWSGPPGVLGGDWEAFRWTEAEGMVGLGDLPGGRLSSQAIDVSGDGSRVIGRGSVPYKVAPFLRDAAGGACVPWPRRLPRRTAST